MDTSNPTPMPTLCEGLVEAIAASLRAEAGAQGVELAVARSSEDIVARVDRKALSMIVMGLVRHAVTGARRGVVKVRVEQRIVDRSRTVEIRVAQYPANCEVPLVTRPSLSGLSLCEELAARVGGHISIDDRDGTSTYVLHFPKL